MVAELSLQIAGGPGAPAEARTALRRCHPELPRELMQIVVLLASELVSNAVKHANAALIEIRCEVVSRSVRVEVADAGPGFGTIPSVLEPDRVGGWGLHLVEELSTRWGVVDTTGARVWFEIDR